MARYSRCSHLCRERAVIDVLRLVCAARRCPVSLSCRHRRKTMQTETRMHIVTVCQEGGKKKKDEKKGN